MGNIKNATVIVTYLIKGAQIQGGDYDYKEKTTSGSPLQEDQRLFVHEDPKYSECSKRVYLNEAFVNHAISDESRPKPKENIKAYTFWNKMSQEQRLGYHIAQYVDDLGGESYSYNILEE